MKLRTILTGALLLAVTAATSSAYAQGRRDDDRRDNDRDGKWVELGCEQVGRGIDRDVVRVGRREGRFAAIRLEAKGNDVNILDLKVIYANGDPDDIRVRSEIREGDQTRPLDLRGRGRSIDRIELVSAKDFSGRGRGRATVCIYGREADDDRRSDDRDRDDRRGDSGGRDDRRGDSGGRDDRGGGGRNWEELGCASVGLLGDRDVIRVGRREGQFKAIKLSVSGNDVNILDLKVVYTNGEPDDIQVRSEIRQGGETRPLDLRGRDRAIDRIELIYRAKPNFKGRARVCALGLQ